MTDHAERCAAFRALHARATPFIIPNPWDAGSARIMAHAGFEALATTSAGLAFSLGRQDGAVTRDEALANARAIIAATPLPVSADLENGYGHAPEIVAETFRLAFASGLAGASVEDATGDPAAPIYPRDHAIARVAAAVAAARAFPHPLPSPPAPKASSTANPTSTRSSLASAPSKPPAPTSSTPPASRTSPPSAASPPPSPAPSTS